MEGLRVEDILDELLQDLKNESDDTVALKQETRKMSLHHRRITKERLRVRQHERALQERLDSERQHLRSLKSETKEVRIRDSEIENELRRLRQEIDSQLSVLDGSFDTNHLCAQVKNQISEREVCHMEWLTYHRKRVGDSIRGPHGKGPGSSVARGNTAFTKECSLDNVSARCEDDDHTEEESEEETDMEKENVIDESFTTNEDDMITMDTSTRSKMAMSSVSAQETMLCLRLQDTTVFDKDDGTYEERD